MSDSIIIGVDQGYAAMKTAHFAFPSGLVAYEYEPYTLSNVLEILCGGQRTPASPEG